MTNAAKPTLGVDLEDLRLGVKDAVRTAAELQFQTIEVPTASGDVTPQALSPSGRRHFARFVEGFGLSLAALSADFPGLRLTDPRTIEERIEKTRQTIELARDLRVPVVTSAIGALTHPENGSPSDHALEALRRIGEFADSRGVHFAIRPSYDDGERIVKVLSALDCPSIRVCLDPAALVMTGANPLAAIERYVQQIGLIHARDGTAGLADRAGGQPRLGQETPLGEGDVDLVGLFKALREADYRAPLIVRRTDSMNPARELALARESLARILR